MIVDILKVLIGLGIGFTQLLVVQLSAIDLHISNHMPKRVCIVCIILVSEFLDNKLLNESMYVKGLKLVPVPFALSQVGMFLPSES